MRRAARATFPIPRPPRRQRKDNGWIRRSPDREGERDPFFTVVGSSGVDRWHRKERRKEAKKRTSSRLKYDTCCCFEVLLFCAEVPKKEERGGQ